MKNQPFSAPVNQDSKRLFELTTIFAAADDDVVSFETVPHPNAKRLVSSFIYEEDGKVFVL